MRPFVAGAVLCFGLCSAIAARADAMYSLTLSGGGSGSFAVSVLPSAVPGQITTYYAAGDANNNGVDTLESLSVAVGGDAFTLAGGLTETSVQFDGGVLSGIEYASSIGSDALQINGLSYALIHIGAGGLPAVGTVNASLVSSTAATPEPSSVFLLGEWVVWWVGALEA